MGVSQCTAACKPCNAGECDAGNCSSAPGSIFQLRQNQQNTLQMLLIALEAFEESCGQEELGPALVTGDQRRAVDAALDSWMASLPRQKGVPLVVDGADRVVSLRLADPAELLIRPRDAPPGDDAERLNLAMLSAVVVGTREIPPVCAAEGCCTTRAAECFLHLSEGDGTVRRLRVECEDPIDAASFGLTLRILQSIGPGLIAGPPEKSPGKDTKGEKRPKPGSLKLDHLTRLASRELSARLSSRSSASARGKTSARGPASKRKNFVGHSHSGDLVAPDSARSAPVQGISSHSTRVSRKSSKQRSLNHPAAAGVPSPARTHPSNCNGVPACQEDGPEAVAGGLPIAKQRSTIEIPDGASATPSGRFHGSLLPKWYHQAMDDDQGHQPTPSSPTATDAPEAQTNAQEVRAFLSECGLAKHFDVLLQSGFDSLEALRVAEDEHLEKVGLPLGHRLLLVRKLKAKPCVLDEEPVTVFDSLDVQRLCKRSTPSHKKGVLDRAFPDFDTDDS